MRNFTNRLACNRADKILFSLGLHAIMVVNIMSLEPGYVAYSCTPYRLRRLHTILCRQYQVVCRPYWYNIVFRMSFYLLTLKFKQFLVSDWPTSVAWASPSHPQLYALQLHCWIYIKLIFRLNYNYYNYLKRHPLNLKSCFKINKLEKLLKLMLTEILLIIKFQRRGI